MRLQGMPYVAGLAQGRLQQGLAEQRADNIVLLSQTECSQLHELPAGLIVIDGAPFAHDMIPLLGLGIPTVIIDPEQAACLEAGSTIRVDGDNGLIITEPLDDQPVQKPMARVSPITREGIEIELRVSARDNRAVQLAKRLGAAAIGLVRSEFLVPADGQTPDSQFYRHAFQAICQAAAPLPVTIRLLDIAADKLPGWLPRVDWAGGTLGLQGVRLFAQEPVHSVYQAQLEAIASLSNQFDIRVLIPYPRSQAELIEWSEQIDRQLGRRPLLGAMAETPAAALQLPEWLEQVDFVALGCNDLMQCLFGADRSRAELRAYLNPYDPALYRFLRQVAASAPGRMDRVQLCGVLSQLPGILPLLLGLGFRVFSVEATSLDSLQRTIAKTSLAEAAALAGKVCAAHHPDQVRQLLVEKTYIF